MTRRTSTPCLLLLLALLNVIFPFSGTADYFHQPATPFPDSSLLPRINIILPARFSPYEQLIHNETRTIFRFYTRRFGPAPVGELTITDSASLSKTSVSGEHLIILNQQPLPFTRLLQRTLAYEIARCWFGTDVITDPFLSLGLPAYAATRYLEAAYGKDNLLDLPVSVSFLSGASDRYLHQVYYYLAAVNNLTRSLPNRRRQTTRL